MTTCVEVRRALSIIRKWEAGPTGVIATDGGTIFYDSRHILKEYQKEPKSITKALLHILLHCFFYHSFQYDKVDRDLWDMGQIWRWRMLS